MLSALDLEHGMHANISNVQYFGKVLGLASKSALDLVRRSPAHYLADHKGAARAETAAMAFGTALHMRIFEPTRFASTYVVEPDFGDCRTTANKERRNAWRAENAGRVPMSADDDSATARMVGSILSHPFAGKLLQEDGQSELTVRWKDAETGIECKSRADRYVPCRAMVIDIKTTEDGRANEFRRSVAKYGYFRQEGMYRDGFAAIGVPLDHFLFVAVEKCAPWAVSVFKLDAPAIEKGYASIHEDMRTLADCLARDHWPAYPPGVQELSLPEWA